MDFHLTKIPKKLLGNLSAAYYVAQKTPAGEWVCVSDEDPKDDIRSWSNLQSAKWSAKNMRDGFGARVDAIILVNDRGRTLLDIEGVLLPQVGVDDELELLSPDEDGILFAPDLGDPPPPSRYADFGSW